ncbi:MAG TPA: potassium-transporting ATPase subunit KdpC [Candidatus Acidoferrales bacterium]|jgi:K+-transporting ATPase ATPase C chain|nr:potassium-transporting ATPase subunit KdpC [Candidatus Acidoferrales bacterium]
MKRNLLTAIWMTLVTTLLLGIIYPLVVTGLAQLIFPAQANGSLLRSNSRIIGSSLIGQPFTQPGYFHSRPSNAGPAGYDASNSNGFNLAPTNKALLDRVAASVKDLQKENPTTPIPVDLVTGSGSGLDPDISPAAAEFQIPRVARERGISQSEVRSFVARHMLGRQLGFLGEPRVNVLELNLELDQRHPLH